MKDIVQIAFSGECKNPVFTTRRGKHLFCAEPTPAGKTYCVVCERQMRRPTRTFIDNANIPRMLAPGRYVGEPESSRIVPVDEFCRAGEAVT